LQIVCESQTKIVCQLKCDQSACEIFKTFVKITYLSVIQGVLIDRNLNRCNFKNC